MFYIEKLPIIEFKNVNYISDSRKNILENINLKICEGDFVAVMGANGCGKTTLAKLMNGLLLPTSGDILVSGMKTDNPKNYPTITKTVSVTFQNPDDQFIASTVEEEIAFGLENICYPSDKIQPKISKVLLDVGLQGFEKRTLNSLSGGQKQKLLLACSLALNPKVLVLDEITAMLDPLSQESITKIVVNLHRNRKTTIVLLTHNIHEACLAQKIVFMKHGQIQATDKPENILTDLNAMKKLDIIPMRSTLLLSNLKNLGYRVSLKNSLNNQLCAKEIINILENNDA